MTNESTHRTALCRVQVHPRGLDGTVWNGIRSENPAASLRPRVAATIAGLDRRGIFQSIAAKNDYE